MKALLLMAVVLSIIAPASAYGQIATFNNKSIQAQTQCLDFNQDGTCEFIILANGTQVANPFNQTAQINQTVPVTAPVENSRTENERDWQETEMTDEEWDELTSGDDNDNNNRDRDEDNDSSGNSSCYNSGFNDGQNGPFSQPTWDHCGDEEGGDDAYYDGFIDGCMSVQGNTRNVCESATDA